MGPCRVTTNLPHARITPPVASAVDATPGVHFRDTSHLACPHVTRPRKAVRACFAIAGAGSLGSFLSAAIRELLIAIEHHNAACVADAPDDDARYIHPRWGRVVIDGIGGSSAGALCGAQIVKSLFHPGYLGEGRALDLSGTISGDWIRGGDFSGLAVEGNRPTRSGPIEAPGWTLLSGAKLHDLALRALTDDGTSPGVHSALDPTSVVGLGITLTDLLGFHDPAEFEVDRVLGHPDFGQSEAAPSRLSRNEGRLKRDLGGRGHAEVRRLFVCGDASAALDAQAFLARTHRSGRCRPIPWGDQASSRLAGLVAASAALPLGVGPIAMTDSISEPGAVYRRLYMDGGILNNKPIAPALELARWHDGMRVMRSMTPGEQEFDGEVVGRLLDYERVVFFMDAFPDRVVDEWRSPHPDRVFGERGVYQLTPEADALRNQQIDDALQVPGSSLGIFFDAILSSLRAQDIREIARTNQRIDHKSAFIDRLADRADLRPVEFRLDSLDKAFAYAEVRRRESGRRLSAEKALQVAARVWESDRVSDLQGRRSVTMVPVYAPRNLEAAFAGEALYSLGGLLDENARRHDARVGARVAREVLDGLRATPGEPKRVHLPHAPDDALPSDTRPLVERLRVLGAAVIDGRNQRNSWLRYFAKLPFNIEPLVRMAKERLDRAALGIDEVERQKTLMPAPADED